MKDLITKLREEKSTLAESSFCKTLQNENIPAMTRMAFGPSMLFFVLGFRDTLGYLKNTASEHPFQLTVNTHCDEDSTHWRWYLADLKLFLEEFDIELDVVGTANELWASKNDAVRNTVYSCIHYSMKYTSPFLRLVIIQVLEATFDAFNDSIIYPLRELDLFDKLSYYGQHHLDAEEDHEFDDWLKVDIEEYTAKLASEGIEIDESEFKVGEELIGELFQAFSDMFVVWENAVHSQNNKMNQAQA